jgi:hypothetical protein
VPVAVDQVAIPFAVVTQLHNGIEVAVLLLIRRSNSGDAALGVEQASYGSRAYSHAAASSHL